MAGAGYDPVAMADFFALLRSEQGRDPGKVERFFSDHPAAGDREARIRSQAESLKVAGSRDVGGFDGMRADLRRLSPAPQRVAQQLEEPRNPDTRDQDSGQYEVRVDQPSSRFQRFEQPNGFFTIEHPDNWRAYASNSGFAVSMAPDGGVVDTGNGQQAMLYGVIVNHYTPFEGETARQQESRQRSYAPFEDTDQWRGSLEDATDDLVRQIIRTNSYLQAQDGQARREQIDEPGVVLGGALRPLARHRAGGEGHGRDPESDRWRRHLRPVHRPRPRLRLDDADLHADAADAERQRRRDPPWSADQLEVVLAAVGGWLARGQGGRVRVSRVACEPRGGNVGIFDGLFNKKEKPRPDFSNVRSGGSSTAPAPGVGGPEAVAPPVITGRTYVVVSGDSLSRIAELRHSIGERPGPDLRGRTAQSPSGRRGRHRLLALRRAPSGSASSQLRPAGDRRCHGVHRPRFGPSPSSPWPAGRIPFSDPPTAGSRSDVSDQQSTRRPAAYHRQMPSCRFGSAATSLAPGWREYRLRAALRTSSWLLIYEDGQVSSTSRRATSAALLAPPGRPGSACSRRCGGRPSATSRRGRSVTGHSTGGAPPWPSRSAGLVYRAGSGSGRRLRPWPR